MLLFWILPAISFAADANPISSALSPENSRMPGHSMLGESFDEGPRRAASLLGTTGRVTFPISTRLPLVQQFFNQGIGQLHGFWYFEAERSFRQAAKLDSDCAMAYFGMALANVNNDARAKGFIAEAVKRKDKASERERKYIDALDAWYKAGTANEKEKATRAKNFVEAIEQMLYQFPDDLEAKAWLCLVIWQNRSDLGMSGNLAIDALMNDVLAVNPYHPVHHYRVHLWDNDKARNAVNSAERCGVSAPGIAHMWHMSGHTYSELHQYFDAAWHQEASTRTDHAYLMRDGIFPDRIHNFAHNNEWLVKNLQFLGRVNDAIALAKNTIDLPRHPKLNSFPGGKSAHFGRLRLFQIYSQFEMWDQLIADAQTSRLGPTTDDAEQVKYFRHLGRACFRQNDVENGRRQLAILERRHSRLKQESDRAVDEAVAKARFEGVDAKEIETRKNQALRPTADKIKTLERAVDELQGYILLSESKPGEAFVRLEKAGDVDEAFLADVEVLAGKPDAAIKRLRDWVGRSPNQTRPLAVLVEMLHRQQKKDEARQVFETLREISGAVDLDVPAFARLRTVADEFGFAGDWRKPKPVARNAAELPDPSTLGPFLWQPGSASDWSLPDANAAPHALADYRGRPVILIFYLGHGCLHCVEQLKAFIPRNKDFGEAGVSLVAISSESVLNLKQSQEKYSDSGEFPFLLVSDESLETFKRYQAYDDFESSPLHGTILIDGAGKIRWHDTGAEPFMNVDFLLAESQRLLNPERMVLPKEPELLDESGPVDALSPRNVFPAPSQPAAKEKTEARGGD